MGMHSESVHIHYCVLMDAYIVSPGSLNFANDFYCLRLVLKIMTSMEVDNNWRSF